MDSVTEIIHFASDPAFAVGEDLKIVAWNKPAQALLGHTPQAVVGRPCHEVLRAILPDGEPLCVPGCEAKGCFARLIPFAARHCLCPRRDSQWISVALSSMAVPSPLNGGSSVTIVFVRPRNEVSPIQNTSSVLRVFTLGHFGLSYGGLGIPIQHWERKQALTLLKCLVTSRGRAVHRDRLIEYLWPEVAEQRGRERLKASIYSLRRELRQAGVERQVIGTAEETYFLCRGAVWVDVEAFEALVKEGDHLVHRQHTDEALRCYKEAAELYRGDYLEEELYSEWCAEEREHLREIYLGAMEKLASILAAQHDFAGAAYTCRKALTQEPCRETLHRARMSYLWDQGRRDEALAQYQTCVQVLAKELSVEPGLETQRLHDKILRSGEEGRS